MYRYKKGDEFFRLTLIEQVGQSPSLEWLMQCSCGSPPIVRKAGDVRRGFPKSCGCLRVEESKQNRRLGRGGRKALDLSQYPPFGKLTALYRLPEKDRNGHILWMCRCECGTEKPITSYNLTHRNTKSCGCEQRKPKARPDPVQVVPMLSMQQLYYLTMIQELGSISNAAHAMGRHQSGLLTAVTSLEQELGLKLFQRHPKPGHALTPAGEAIVQRAKQMVELMKEIHEACDELKSQELTV